MNITKLCPQCKRGKASLELDNHSFACPYINCHNGTTCSKFERVEESVKKGFWENIFSFNKDA